MTARGRVLVERSVAASRRMGQPRPGRRASPRDGSTLPRRSRSSLPVVSTARAVCYPVALNRHQRHILDSTLMPAPVGPDRRERGSRVWPSLPPRRLALSAF